MRAISEIVKSGNIGEIANVGDSRAISEMVKRFNVMGRADLPEAVKELVNEIFSRLITIHTGWKGAVPADDSDGWRKQYCRELAGCFQRRGTVTPEDLKRGFEYAEKVAANDRDGKYLPPASMFVKWCKPTAVPCHRAFDEPTEGERKQLAQLMTPRSEYKSRIAEIRAAALA